MPFAGIKVAWFFIEVLFVNLFTDETYKFLNYISVLIYIFVAIYGKKTRHYLSIYLKKADADWLNIVVCALGEKK